MKTIPKRISTAILNSFGAGVVPRVGLEFVAVGRKDEIESILEDLENVAQGGAAFRFFIGRFGSGKSFLIQLIRNHAMDLGFVVADADLSPERRLTGGSGKGAATYRELVNNMATRTRPSGSALPAILEKWISGIQSCVASDAGIKPTDAGFNEAVEKAIVDAINDMKELVHGFDFATVLSTYWRGHCENDDEAKEAALRWLRGEYPTKTDAKKDLGVRVIIDDDSWYDYMKLLASFVTRIGYKGMLFFLDEAVNLYKITNTQSRTNNYEKLLTMFNDTMQGKAASIGIFVGGTPQFLEDRRRGLYSYEALRTRLGSSKFARDGLKDVSGPIIKLDPLSIEEVFVLLKRVLDVHSAHYGIVPAVSDDDLKDFMKVIASRVGAGRLLTPREFLKEFIAVLNMLRANDSLSFSGIIHGKDYSPAPAPVDESVAGTEFEEFTL